MAFYSPSHMLEGYRLSLSREHPFFQALLSVPHLPGEPWSPLCSREKPLTPSHQSLDFFLHLHPLGPREGKGGENKGPTLKKESEVEIRGAPLLTPASAGPYHPRITSPMLH